MPRRGLHAFAIAQGGEVIVQAGSSVRATWVGERTSKARYSKLRDNLSQTARSLGRMIPRFSHKITHFPAHHLQRRSY
ncbi:hypothetical protein DS901_05725 [Loktanella sp. D2R18]|nr:hypothetical protein DS901_05725 [Loktanella sp. D2R18]